MSFIESIFKYLFFYIFGVFVAILVSGAVLSYFAVENLSSPLTKMDPEKNLSKSRKQQVIDEQEGFSSEPSFRSALPWVNANLQEITQIGEQYVAELNDFDELRSSIPLSESNAKICQLICAPSSFDLRRSHDERTDYLVKFYQRSSKLALRDPFFHVKLREIGFLSDLFPESFRDLFKEITSYRDQHLSFRQKLGFALRLEWAALKELPSLKGRWNSLRRDKRSLYALRYFVTSCQEGRKPRKELLERCEKRFPNGLE